VVRGRAVDERGEPIAAACLALLPHDGVTVAAALAEPSARSDAEGRFELTIATPAAPAEWRVPVLTAPGRAMVRLGLSGRWPWLDRHAIDLGDVVVPSGVTLRGHVRTADGRPLAGAQIEAEDVLTEFARWQLWSSDFQHGYTSGALTDAQGAFALDGVPAGGVALTVCADGHHRLELPFVLPDEPLDLTLTPGGHAEGVVKDPQGRPCAGATVTVRYVAGDDRSKRHHSGAGGAFEVTLALPGAYRIEAHGENIQWTTGKARGEVRDGPARDLVLTTGPAIDPARSLVLRTTDAATGKAIEEVRATVTWAPPDLLEHQRSQLFQMHDRGEPQRGPGEVGLPGPGPDEPPTGMVVVRAKGYAPLVLEDVEWSDREPPLLEAKLVRESVLTGVAVDARTHAPLAGALVVSGDDDEGSPWFAADHDEFEPGRRLTDAAGRFRVDGLAAGTHRLRLMMSGRPPGEAVEVEVGPAATKEGIELALPPGSRVTGKLTGGAIGEGWRLHLRALREGGRWRHPQEEEWSMPRAAIAADGSFAFAGVPAGNHELRLRIPHRGGQGGWIELPLDLLRVRTADLERDFDLGETLPGTVHGTVTVAGAELPRQRLVVAAFLPPGEDSPSWREQPYVLEPVAADGSFALPAAPGEQRIEVLDAATRIPLAIREGVRVGAGARVELPLRVELARVRVRLKPEKDGGSLIAARLEVLVQHERRRPAERAPFLGRDEFEFDSGAGVALAGRADDVELLLPLCPTRFLVRAHHAEVYEADWRTPPLGEAESTPKRDGDNLVEVVVRTPARPEGK